MRKLKLQTMIAGFIFAIVLFGFSSCATSNNVDISKPQVLSEKEFSDIKLWKANKKKMFVQNHVENLENLKLRPYNTWVASYEGFRVASLLGLNDNFTTEEMVDFTKALFDGMPMLADTGDLIKSIVFAKWYYDGSPLVLNVTRAFTAEKIPTVVYMFNTWDNVSKYRLPLIKKAGIAFEYPRLRNADGIFQREFLDSYIMTWIQSGFISASNAFGQKLPEFSSVETNIEKINLTDDWLRDGNLENDEEVLKVLLEMLETTELTPIENVFARMQLFMYHLYHAEVDKAQAVIDSLKESNILEASGISKTEIGVLAKRDLQRILDVAIILSNK